jgi:phosphoadenosine phosphosulfate reductase
MPKDTYLIPAETESAKVAEMNLQQRVDRAIALLKAHEPEDGYYLAFSGGKDSCALKKIAELSGVKFEARYNQTTIDPPELVRFLKQHCPDVQWNLPKHGSMMARVAARSAAPPTRMVRWCCEEYKEHSGDGRVKLIGVRQAEAPRRKAWLEVAQDYDKNKVICPIVYWSDDQLWEFIRAYGVQYCELYDEVFEGHKWDRLGCVDCPLASVEKRQRERRRWPKMAENWKKAVIKNWENWHDKPRKDGKLRFHAKFQSGEEFYEWWLNENTADPMREDCQSGSLWALVESDDMVIDPNPSHLPEPAASTSSPDIATQPESSTNSQG